MYKQTNTTSQSDESAGGRQMSETEKAIERCQNEMKQIIKDIQKCELPKITKVRTYKNSENVETCKFGHHEITNSGNPRN